MSRENDDDDDAALRAWLLAFGIAILAFVTILGTVHAQAPDALTEIDNLRIQVALLTKQYCDLAVERAVSQTQAAIMAAHPGYRWNPESGALVKVEPAK